MLALRVCKGLGGVVRRVGTMAGESGASTRGALIVFEGCDRSGKTTQCRKLVDSLNADGFNTQLWRFPEGKTDVGAMCRAYLTRKMELEDHAVHLLFAANRWELVPKMLELLEQGVTLIVDRYAFSGVAFSAAKSNMNLDWCKNPERGLPQPDLVLYLTLTAEEAAKRAEFGGERYEQTDFQLKVAENYKKLNDYYWKEVDASKSIEDLHVDIKEIILPVIKNVGSKPVGTLWT